MIILTIWKTFSSIKRISGISKGASVTWGQVRNGFDSEGTPKLGLDWWLGRGMGSQGT